MIPPRPYFIACLINNGQVIGAVVCRAISHITVSEHATIQEAEAALANLLQQGTMQ